MVTTGFGLGMNDMVRLSPDDGAGEGVETNDSTDAGNTGDNESTDDSANVDIAAEIARLRSELAKAKAATDKATKEAGDYKKQLRSKMSADEAAAEEKRAADEARDKELNELRKRFAVAETSRKVMALGGDETASAKIAEYLYGAEDPDAALAAIQKIWTAREKAIRLEFSKIPAPSAGSTDGPTITREQLAGMGYKDRVEFARKNPDEYNKLMGR